jgi:chromobox protein 1
MLTPRNNGSGDKELTDSARETTVLDDYYASKGGREKILEEIRNGLKNKKRGRPQSNTPTSSSKRSRKNGDHPGNTSPPATAKQVAWKPPAGSWEDQITELDACEDEESGKLMVYLTWKDGHKTQHETSVIYKRCPQKVCDVASINRPIAYNWITDA